MSRVRRVCAVTGTRAEFGLLAPVMRAIREAGLELQTVASGMHLSREFGLTYREIEAAGFPIDARVDMTLSGDDHAAMAKSIGVGVLGMTQAFQALDPDVVLVLGDRVEAFAAAIAGAGLHKVVAHVHGGERTQGGLDESMRHAITKLAHVHFAATPLSRERILRLGERPERVHLVGAPGLDVALAAPRLSLDELSSRLGVPLRPPYLVVVQHPVTTEMDEAAAQMRATLDAVRRSGIPAVALYPNADAGGRSMIEALEAHAGEPWLHAVPSVPHETYLSLLASCAALVGNTSSGIVEAPSLRVPYVHVGSRQAGRERSTNVVDASHAPDDILRAIREATSPGFREVVDACVSPYGDGKAGARIAEALRNLEVTRDLLQKQIVD